MYLMYHGRACWRELSHIHADCLKRPARRAIAAGQAAPDILMRINKKLDVVLTGLLDDSCQIIQIRLVIDPRSGVFYRFPGHQEAQKGEAPPFQAGEMFVGFTQGEGATHERHFAVVEKPGRVIRCPIGGDGELGTAGKIHTAQNQRASVVILKPGSVSLNHMHLHRFRMKPIVAP